MLENNLRVREETLVAAHANFLKGNEKKVNALKLHGLWLPQENGTCATFDKPKTCDSDSAICKPVDNHKNKGKTENHEDHGKPIKSTVRIWL